MSKERTYRSIVHLFRHFPGDYSGYIPNNFNMSDQAILQHLLDTRSELLSNLQTLGFPLGTQNFQTIPCVELEEVESHECPCAPPSGCKWLKSKKPLPRYIKISSVSTITGQDNISYIDWTKIKHKFNSRYPVKNKRYYTLRDIGQGTFLYVLNDSFLKMISLSAVFEDPKCVLEFGGCKKDLTKYKCNPWNTPFVLDGGLINKVLKNAWQTLPQLKQVAPDDRKNNNLQDRQGLDNDTI